MAILPSPILLFDLAMMSRALWLLAGILSLLGPGCTPRLYTRPGLCQSGLRAENKFVTLKQVVTIWKREEYKNRTEWVAAHP